jgi:hypothetical protein
MKIKGIKQFSFLGFTALILSSCLSTETDTVGFGDAYVLVEIIDQDTLTGLGLHAFSYSEFSAVTVNLEGNEEKSYVLTPYLGYKQDFIWNTPTEEFSAELPEAGNYVFNATFANGQRQTFINKLLDQVVMPPDIKECQYNTSNSLIETEWEKVTNAGTYNVKLMNQSGDILFVSEILTNATTRYSFGKNTPGWLISTFPANGQNLVVEVVSYLVEPGTGSSKLQSLGRARRDVTWGN